MEKENLDFTYAAIRDAQDLIRFTDTKTGAAISVVAGIMAGLFSTLENILKYHAYFSCYLCALFWVTVLLVAASVWIAIRIIKPTHNPEASVDITNQAIPKLKFFIPANKYGFLGKLLLPFFNSDNFHLSETLADHKKNIKEASRDDIAIALSMELLKVSFLRNLKVARFNTLVTCIVLTTISFLTFFICYTNQMVLIKKLVACGCIS
jgi:hypothetical protein